MLLTWPIKFTCSKLCNSCKLVLNFRSRSMSTLIRLKWFGKGRESDDGPGLAISIHSGSFSLLEFIMGIWQLVYSMQLKCSKVVFQIESYTPIQPNPTPQVFINTILFLHCSSYRSRSAIISYAMTFRKWDFKSESSMTLF